MSEETRKILEMLAEGKISVEDADRLLERLKSPGSQETGSGLDAGSYVEMPGTGKAGGSKLKYLRVTVLSQDGDRVNIRVPLALVRAGVKLTTVLPREVQEKLDRKGVDLSALSTLSGEELIEALRELNVDVDSKDGDKVRIFCD